MKRGDMRLRLDAVAVSLCGCKGYITRYEYNALQDELAATRKRLAESEEETRKVRKETKPGRYETFQQGFAQWALSAHSSRFRPAARLLYSSLSGSRTLAT